MSCQNCSPAHARDTIKSNVKQGWMKGAGCDADGSRIHLLDRRRYIEDEGSEKTEDQSLNYKKASNSGSEDENRGNFLCTNVATNYKPKWVRLLLREWFRRKAEPVVRHAELCSALARD
ncbi:hypothetical protein Q1695_006227 [Nippostrongylus brasiliensis]|nr:hypothetical protein Q1695_006227 [Nippostrongylus brasiliensis]